MTRQDGALSVQTFVALERATYRLERQHGQRPTIDELADELGLSGPEVRQVMEAAQGTITFRPIERPNLR